MLRLGPDHSGLSSPALRQPLCPHWPWLPAPASQSRKIPQTGLPDSPAPRRVCQPSLPPGLCPARPVRGTCPPVLAPYRRGPCIPTGAPLCCPLGGPKVNPTLPGLGTGLALLGTRPHVWNSQAYSKWCGWSERCPRQWQHSSLHHTLTAHFRSLQVTRNRHRDPQQCPYLDFAPTKGGLA